MSNEYLTFSSSFSKRWVKVRRFSAVLFLFLLPFFHRAQTRPVNGFVLSERDSTPGSFCNLQFVRASGEVVNIMAEPDGSFRCRLVPGYYDVKARLMGFRDTTFHFLLLRDQPIQDVRFFLVPVEISFNTVSVMADPEDFARSVLKRAIRARAALAGEKRSYSFSAYRKISLTETCPDTSEAAADSLYVGMSKRNRPRKTYQAYLSETVSEMKYRYPNQFSELVIGQFDHSKRKPSESLAISFSFDYGEKDIARQDPGYDNNFILRSQRGYLDYSVYDRLLDLPSIHEKPILSPIGDGALLSYRPDFHYSYLLDSMEIYVIRIRPLVPGEPLFSGELHIRASDFAVIQANLALSESVSPVFQNLNLFQEYKVVNGSAWLSRCVIDYSSNAGRSEFHGSVEVFNDGFERATDDIEFTDETRILPDSAYRRSADFWFAQRMVPLNALENSYANYCDSLQNLYASKEYMDEQDSINNRIRFMDLLFYGVSWRLRDRQSLFYFYPLTMQMNFVGVGGYRHKFGGAWLKELPNAWQLETRAEMDYGFRNQDVRGKLGVGLTYYPLKFVRTFLQVGDYYEMVNTYASLSSILNRSNFVRTRTMSAAQRMEIFNGFYAELSGELCRQQPILGLQQDLWSQQVFGENNTPVSFDEYVKMEFRLDLSYRIHQKYQVKRGKKIVLGSDFPTLRGAFRFGIPDWMGSQVNFGYAEAGAFHDVTLGRLGQLQWSVNGGGFFNQTRLRVTEHRYFRGSDPYLFSDPLKSFQLLGPTLSTSDIFFRVNGFHHFNGLLLSKIPILYRLRLTEAAGAGFLAIPSQRLAHSEFYAGVERVVRIRRELFRFGVYGCTSLSTAGRNVWELKVGVNFYNSFAKRWQY
jgi:hypothetical protein